MTPRNASLVIFAVLAGGAAYFAINAYTPSRPSAYPEFEAVPAAEFDRARAALPAKTSGFGDYGPEIAERTRRRLAGCSPWAVVAVLVERAGKHSGSMSYGRCFEDDMRKPVGAWLAEQAEDTLNAVLLRLAADEEMEFALRDTAIVTLCRPDNVDALPGLVRLAMDMEAENTVRTRVLSRLHRIGVPPGGEFEALLHLPFRDHDYYAAAVLALTGRPIAPSLVLEGLHQGHWADQGLRRLLVLAATALAPEDQAIAARARRARTTIETEWGFSRDGKEGLAADEAVDDLVTSVAGWLERHPEVRDSPFEREWAEVRAGDRQERARRVLEAEAPETLPEAEIDFGAAVLRVLDEEGKWRDRPLAALDRMASLFRREMEGAASPQARLEVLHRRLMPHHTRISSFIEDGPSSFLDRVLRERAGNCVGLTSLYVALGERLDLPLVAVALPNHAFLRWEDGADSFDIELTDRGRIRTAEDLVGKTPRVLTKKGLVSIVLSNRSSVFLESPMIRNEGRLESALALAERAIVWDAENESAHLALARCLTRMGEIEKALAAAETAARLAPGSPNPRLTTAESLLLADRIEEALEWFGRARDMDPERTEAVHGRLICLGKLGRYDEVVREADAFPKYGDHHGIWLLRLLAMVRLGRDGWEASLEDRPMMPPGSWDVRMRVVELLLERDAGDDALRVLAKLSDLDREFGEAADSPDDHVVTVECRVEHLGDHKTLMNAKEVRARYREAQGLRSEAYEKTGQPEKAQAIRRKLSD